MTYKKRGNYDILRYMLQTYDISEFISTVELFHEEAMLRELAEKSLHEFIKQAWPVIEGPAAIFSDGWHIGALCEHLEAVYRGEIENLLVNVPPRSCKTNLISVAFCPWIWTMEPIYRFLYAAYGEDIAIDASLSSRKLIMSDWYQQRWGDKYNLIREQNNKKKFVNSHTGHRTCMGVRGQVTGRGGSINILDDPNNAKDGESEVTRDSTNKWFGSTWGSRQNDLKTGRLILVQQRIHSEDLSGYIMKNHDDDGSWVKLILPMEYEENRKCRTISLPSTNGKVWEDPRKKEGEIIWPQAWGQKELKKIKGFLGHAYVIAGQLQQRPAPAEGGYIKRHWFPQWSYKQLPRLEMVIQSWDTGYKKEDMRKKNKNQPCYSVCTTFGVFKDKEDLDNLILLNMWRDRVEYPELREVAYKCYQDWRYNAVTTIKPDGSHVPDMVLIEDKASGQSLIQDFRRKGILATAFDPARYGDKDRRVHMTTPMMKEGLVHLPINQDTGKMWGYAKLFLDECCLYPNGSSRDIVDTLTQALIKVRDGHIIRNPSDKPLRRKHEEKNQVRYY